MSTSAATNAKSRAQKRTAPKPRLSPELIAEAGLELASRPGVLNISVRDLGTHLGVDPTAIYRHFRSKEQLMQALLDGLFQRACASVTAPPEDWKSRLRELASSTLTEFIRLPGIAAEAVVLTTHGPGEADSIELMLDAFARAGLSDDDTVRHYAMLASHILSVGAGMARSRVSDPTGELESSAWFEGPVRVDPVTHPQLTRFGPRIVRFGDQELYLLGVEAVIESAERLTST